MRLSSLLIRQLSIPLTFEFAHGKASRSSCDSLIVEVRTDAGIGYGEALVREYVTGSVDPNPAGLLDQAANIVGRLAAPLADRYLDWLEIRSFLEAIDVRPQELPFLCGLEGALLDAACAEQNADIYRLLRAEPAGTQVRYGATLPILSPKASKGFLALCRSLRLASLRVKLGREIADSEMALEMARTALGPDFDIRVDANASWEYEDAQRHLPLLRRCAITLVEEPFGKGRPENKRFAKDLEAIGGNLAADESALTVEDIRQICSEGVFRMANIRLAKNGGLLHALRMCQAAREGGLAFQIGCHVGETGILSAAGRALASLMPDAAYVDGSYDRFILGGNIITQDITFGPGGCAPVLRGLGLGYRVDRDRLEEYTRAERLCS